MDINVYRSEGAASSVASRDFINRVYLWMAFGLAVTAAVSYGLSTSPRLLYALFSGGTATFFILVVIELGLVLFLSARVMTLSPATAQALFVAYAAVNGLTLAPIFLVYTGESVGTAFVTSAAMFGGMSAYGMLTKRDLSGWRSFLMMGLYGLIISGLINIFVGGSFASLVISVMGVLIFTGLAAYDTHKIRQAAEMADAYGEAAANAAIIGALTLYLDFINIFIYTLRIFGRRK